MTVAELNEKREKLYRQIKTAADAFKANGEKWADDASAKAWQLLNTEYDLVMDQLETATAGERVDSRLAAIDERNSRPINPNNIGLDDAGDGYVGTRRTPGGRAAKAEDGREYVVDAKGRKHPLLRGGDAIAAFLPRETRGQHAGVRLGDYLRAMAMGARNPGERNALSESGGSSGGYTVPTRLAAELIDLLRAKSRVIEAGAKTIRLDTEETAFAMLASEPTPGWFGEGVSMSEQDATFARLIFTARTLRMLVKCSRELLEDSVNINSKLPAVFANSLGAELDRVALLGIGAGAGDGPQPLGIVNYTEVNSVSMGDNGAAIADYTKVLDAVEAIETDNAETPTTAIMHPRTKRAFAGLEDSTGQPLMRPETIKNMSFLTTTKIPITQTQGSASNASTIVVGGFGELVLAIRSEVRIDLLTERYAEEFRYGFLVSMRADCGAFYEKAFAKIIGVIP